jgi:hypothetical protein
VSDIDAVLDGGGEGVCAHEWTKPWGEMLCVKRLTTYRCIVTRIGSTQAVGIAENVNGALVDRGRVMLAGGKSDKVRVGSVLKVNALGLTENGKLREPRLDSDSASSWLISY